MEKFDIKSFVEGYLEALCSPVRQFSQPGTNVPENNLVSFDGYTLQDVNGVYLTFKEDE